MTQTSRTFLTCTVAIAPKARSCSPLRRSVFYAIVVIMGSLHHFNVRLSGATPPNCLRVLAVVSMPCHALQDGMMTRCCS